MPIERQQKILEWLSRYKSATMEELADVLCYSRSTVRRDVLELESMGVVERQKGRVNLLITTSRERHRLLRVHEHLEAKGQIAALTTDFIADGMSLFLDASTTVQQVCPLLRRYQHLTVVTNGMETARSITEMGHIGLFFTGGYWREDTGSFLGEPAVDFVRQFRVDLCLLSCCGIDENGLYEASLQQAYVKQAMLRHAGSTLVLCDSTKFGRPFKYRLADFRDVAYILSEIPPPEPIEAAIHRGNGECLIPQEDPR